MNPKLLTNRALENYLEEDSFDFLTKAEAIKIFLEQNSTSLDQNKMLVLYGNWGSGKTSLMRHIEKTISSDIYKTVFFEAWEHEKDENLALSLCDALTESLNGKFTEVVKDFMKGALLTLKSFTNGITLKAPAFLTGLGLDLEFSGEKYIKAIDEAIDKSPNPSFFTSNRTFKEKFIAIEKLVLKESKATKIIVFVDDLDRCEPENVLNLITALKLFFTYGENTVFFCGIDKDAVTKAVKTKYKDVIKSEEYMEKVFDVAFNMPRTFSLKKLLNPYFDGQIKIKDSNHYQLDIIEDFFKSINFTNPRHLKKILSKYEILKSFKVLSTISEEIRNLIPNIITNDKDGSTFETIYCLFIIILYEFHIREFEDIELYEQKIIKYVDILNQSQREIRNGYTKATANSEINNYILISSIKNSTYYDIINRNNFAGNKTVGFIRLLFIFSHSSPSTLGTFFDDEANKYTYHFTDNSITTNFCKFLIKKQDLVRNDGASSKYVIWNLFEMVKYLL